MIRHWVNFGQPSLLYTAFIQPGRRNPYALLLAKTGPAGP